MIEHGYVEDLLLYKYNLHYFKLVQNAKDHLIFSNILYLFWKFTG